MAYASDRLRERWKSKMEGGDAPAPEDDAPEGESDSKPSDRSVQLTEMEMKSLAGKYQPGAEVTCEIVGRLDDSGKLDINEIRSSGPVDASAGMAPAMRTNPALAPS